MHYLTVGRLSGLFQLAPSRIARTLEEAGVKPELTLNEQRYYPEEKAVEALRQTGLQQPAITRRQENP
jgi:hypothetical protein